MDPMNQKKKKKLKTKLPAHLRNRQPVRASTNWSSHNTIQPETDDNHNMFRYCYSRNMMFLGFRR